MKQHNINNAFGYALCDVISPQETFPVNILKMVCS